MMKHIIDIYQDKADQALVEMQKAEQNYKHTHNIGWLIISIEWEIIARCYLDLAEDILEHL